MPLVLLMLSQGKDLSTNSQHQNSNPLDESDIDTVFVRFNGTSSDHAKAAQNQSEVTSDTSSNRIFANTSCSIFASQEAENTTKKQQFHLLIDVGQGVIESLDGGVGDIKSRAPDLEVNAIPDAVLISHGHKDHISDLPRLADRVGQYLWDQDRKIPVYCTKECQEQILSAFPSLFEPNAPAGSPPCFQFNTINPKERIDIGPFKVAPILADHSSDTEKGESLVFVIQKGNTKVITGWDFKSIPELDETTFWNPTLLVLGTESYNQHPSVTGMISVSDAFNLVRRWNAKECFVLHYSGIADLEDGRNQWFMGPKEPMDSDKLQQTIDKTLKITGAEGKFRITVAKQGTVWSSKEYHDRLREYRSSMEAKETGNGKSSTHIEIDTLESYLIKLDTLDKGNLLKLGIEDKIQSFEPEFERPRRNPNSPIVSASSIKGMFAKGPELKSLRVIRNVEEAGEQKDPDMPDHAYVEIDIVKGKKTVFHKIMPVSTPDADDLTKYIEANFQTLTKASAA